MFLYVGSNKGIPIKKIIGIFDMDNATLSSVTRKYLSERERKKAIISASLEEIPKSFILYTDSDGEEKICFSQFSSISLKGRIDYALKSDFR